MQICFYLYAKAPINHLVQSSIKVRQMDEKLRGKEVANTARRFKHNLSTKLIYTL
jgi:hypothetical protein